MKEEGGFKYCHLWSGFVIVCCVGHKSGKCGFSNWCTANQPWVGIENMQSKVLGERLKNDRFALVYKDIMQVA